MLVFSGVASFLHHCFVFLSDDANDGLDLLSVNSVWHCWSYRSSGSARGRISSVNMSALRQKSYFLFSYSVTCLAAVVSWAVQCASPRLWCLAGLLLTLWWLWWPGTISTKPCRGSLLQPLAHLCPREPQLCSSPAGLHPHGLALLLWWPLQASTAWDGLEQSLQGWLEQETVGSRKWYWVCRTETVLFPKKSLAIWNIKVLTFLCDGGICFWKFLCFPKHSTSSCTTVDFPPPLTLPLGKRLWIQGQCFNLTCIISYFHLVLGGPWWL